MNVSKKSLNIVHVASEVEPFSKKGGLGNVLNSLPRAVRDLGHNVIVITPYHEQAIRGSGESFSRIGERTQVEISEGVWQEVEYFESRLPGSDVPVYFVANREWFGSPNDVYGSLRENARFFFFNVAALHLLKTLNWVPDVIHCHDWHAGLIPYFLKGRYRKDAFWRATATLFTIHTSRSSSGMIGGPSPKPNGTMGEANSLSLTILKKSRRSTL